MEVDIMKFRVYNTVGFGGFLGIIGQNPSVSMSQPVTCCDLSVSLQEFKVYSSGFL